MAFRDAYGKKKKKNYEQNEWPVSQPVCIDVLLILKNNIQLELRGQVFKPLTVMSFFSYLLLGPKVFSARLGINCFRESGVSI